MDQNYIREIDLNRIYNYLLYHLRELFNIQNLVVYLKTIYNNIILQNFVDNYLNMYNNIIKLYDNYNSLLKNTYQNYIDYSDNSELFSYYNIIIYNHKYIV
jgi:hypothetical protein